MFPFNQQQMRIFRGIEIVAIYLLIAFNLKTHHVREATIGVVVQLARGQLGGSSPPDPRGRPSAEFKKIIIFLWCALWLTSSSHLSIFRSYRGNP
jgi:hypothetical protein